MAMGGREYIPKFLGDNGWYQQPEPKPHVLTDAEIIAFREEKRREAEKREAYKKEVERKEAEKQLKTEKGKKIFENLSQEDKDRLIGVVEDEVITMDRAYRMLTDMSVQDIILNCYE